MTKEDAKGKLPKLRLPSDYVTSETPEAPVRWFRTQDGSLVLQQAWVTHYHSGKRAYEWRDVPIEGPEAWDGGKAKGQGE